MVVMRRHPRRDKQIARVSDVIKNQKLEAMNPEVLFGRVSTDDIMDYRPDALAAASVNALRQVLAWDGKSARVDVDKVKGVDLGGRPVTLVTIVDRNQPFLFDSVMGEISTSHRETYLAAHPVIAVNHDGRGRLQDLVLYVSNETDESWQRVSIIQIHLPALSDASTAELKRNLTRVLDQVHHAVVDWGAMLGRLDQVIAELEVSETFHHIPEHEEALAFLAWLRDDNFTFLGMREYHFSGTGRNALVERAGGTGLGILSDPDVRVLRRGDDHVTTTPELLAFLQGPDPLIVTKANVRSLVHRRAYMDYIGVKRYDDSGRVSGELRIVGLFTSSAYTRSVTRIPLLRSKATSVIASFGFDSESHSGKVLLNALEGYPRDELFQVDVPMLAGFCEQIIELTERPRVRVLPRIDRFDRFVSVLVYVPRDQYDSDTRERIGAYLKDVFDARLSAYYPAFPEGGVARVHFILGRSEGRTPRISQDTLENAVRRIVTRWEDRFAILAGVDALSLHTSDAYRDYFTPEEAVDDLPNFLASVGDSRICIDFYQRDGETSDHLSLKIFHPDEPVELSRRVPLLENLGFNVISEQTFEVAVGADVTQTRKVVLHNMELVHRQGIAVDLALLVHMLDEAFMSTWFGHVSNDSFNRLVINAGLSVREVTVLRAYSRYLRQTGITYSQGFIASTLNRYPEIAAEVFKLFRSRFDLPPKSTKRSHDTDAILHRIEAELNRVPSLDDDRVLRRYVNAIQGTLRTNYYQTDADDQPPRTLAFKFDPKTLDGLPQPRPYREIFVYGSEVEGVHLRFGPIARGGLRWSDRAQDYRTEVLGLVKAQQVKNAVIVPVGSKGGFLPKRLPDGGSRDDVVRAGREAYKTFISTMLSITDNIVDDAIVSPPRTICHDGEDPYFVVAADKGTATFSDTANAISQAHHFWLDDAFASGGSAGYDHKKMGITARGAWEAVERHFREMDVNIQKTEFSVVGVGDMSGDVFGNGMLLSKKIRLVAAFDHRDIFIDPQPDCAVSFKERTRMFKLGRSSWQDYDSSTLSAGGMIISRNEKSVKLTPEAAAAIGFTKTQGTPFEIINRILRADVDLLWFGGIGTYIKAEGESDADVGDRANDAVRVTAGEVRAKVIGEGANLGVTQRGRIAYNMKGGRCNSDAIDNSAGVNSSDLEVNIKIALASAMRVGRLTRENRNALLVSMTEEVAALVLRNNYLQTLAISLIDRRSRRATGDLARLMDRLEEEGHLDREVETLPDDQVLNERIVGDKPLTRAEVGVLLSYAKISLYDSLTKSELLDDPYFETDLIGYFPARMHKRYGGDIKGHPLRRDIIGTVLANDAINRGSPIFVSRLVEATGMLPSDIVKVYVIVRDGLELPELYDAIDSLDNRIPGDFQNELYAGVGHVVQSVSRWALKTGINSAEIARTVRAMRKAKQTLEPLLGQLMPEFMKEETEHWYQRSTEHGVPAKLARRLCQLPALSLVPEIEQVARQAKADLKKAASVYFGVGEMFRIGRIHLAAHGAAVTDHYETLAFSRSLDEINAARRAITRTALLRFGRQKDPLAAWRADDSVRIDRVQERIIALAEAGEVSVARLTVAAGMMSDVARERQ